MIKRVIWSDEARADIRAIDRETALRLLKALARFLQTEAGNVKQLHGFEPPRYRLRVGDGASSSALSATTPSKSFTSKIAEKLIDKSDYFRPRRRDRQAKLILKDIFRKKENALC